MTKNGLWDPCKANLIKAINSVDDEDTELVVVVFADDKTPVNNVWLKIEDVATKKGKQTLVNFINGLKAPVKTSMTNLYRPWMDFYNEIKEDKVNYMFLMTDGGHEQGGDFYGAIDSWDNRTSDLTYGFFVELTNNVSPQERVARDKARKHIDKQKERLWRVSSADVNINLIRLESEVKFNIRNEKSVDIPAYFLGDTAKRVQLFDSLDFFIDDAAFSITKKEVYDNKIRLYFSTDIGDKASYPEKVDMTLNVVKKGCPMTFLLTPRINLVVINEKERTMFLSKETLSGRSERYDAFGWVKEQTIPFESHLDLTFSPDAIADAECFAELTLVDKDGNSISPTTMTLSVNGKNCVENKFVVTPNDSAINFQIMFAEGAKSGKHKCYLRLSDNKLDRVGNISLKDGDTPDVLKLHVKYDYPMNPLKNGLMWCVIAIVAALIFWFTVVKPIKYPRFPQFKKEILIKQNGQIVNQRTVNFKGNRKVVFATKKIKQGFLNRLFTGRIYTIIHPTFTTPIYFVPRKKKRAMAVGTGYMITPNPIPQNGEAKIENPTIKMEINLK